MGRRTVWISDELEQLVASELEDVNWSAALQAGLRALVDCDHGQLECSHCGHGTRRDELVGPVLRDFYSAVMFELGLKVKTAGYEGAARIVRRVAADHGVPGLIGIPVPRATRANHEQRSDEQHQAATALPLEADARRRHPTALPVPLDHPGPRAATPQEQTA